MCPYGQEQDDIMSDAEHDEMWKRLLKAEHEHAIFVSGALLLSSDLARDFEQAITGVNFRREALRILILRDDAKLSQALFHVLVDQASVGHSDIDIVRLAIGAMPRRWVLDHIEPIADEVLAKAVDDEEWKRLIELFHVLDEGLARRLIARALIHDDEEVRDFARDALEWAAS